MRNFLRDESGQAIVEYVLALAMSISVVSIIAISFRKSVMSLWVSFTKDIQAACPGCPPDPSIRKLK